MNFMSREEISMIASVSDLWQTCDGWCSNRCVEKLGSVIWQLQIGHSFSPRPAERFYERALAHCAYAHLHEQSRA